MVAKEFLEIMACPECGGEFKDKKEYLLCMGCDEKYEVKEGIPVFAD